MFPITYIRISPLNMRGRYNDVILEAKLLHNAMRSRCNDVILELKLLRKLSFAFPDVTVTVIFNFCYIFESCRLKSL